MKVLNITGDRNFKPGSERFDLQHAAVEVFEVVYWSRGSLWPALPAGQFDVVTAQDPFWRGLFALWAAKRKRAKLNIQVHTDLSVYRGVKHVLAQRILGHADSVRVVSQKLAEQVKRVAPHAPVAVLPVFIDAERFTKIQQEPHEGKNILWIGRFEDEKNPLAAIEILKEVRKIGIDVKLTMLGAGSLQQRLIDAAIGLPVEMPGWQDPVKYLSSADVVLSTSLHESFGASIVEALASGVPVVAPDVGVAKEAGATILPLGELDKGVIEVLQSGRKGILKILLLNQSEWVKEWVKTLQ